MHIIATQYTLQYKSFDIYIAGCKGNPHCRNCHNPETWNFNQGRRYDEIYSNEITDKIKSFNHLIDKIMIFGGEPLDQEYIELHTLLSDIKKTNKELWIFTRYNIEDVPSIVKVYCDYIKCGRYLEELKTDSNIQYGINLATSNQRIYKKGVDY